MPINDQTEKSKTVDTAQQALSASEDKAGVASREREAADRRAMAHVKPGETRIVAGAGVRTPGGGGRVIKVHEVDVPDAKFGFQRKTMVDVDVQGKVQQWPIDEVESSPGSGVTSAVVGEAADAPAPGTRTDRFSGRGAE